ncbi:hypothetical protein Pmar_PMAR003631 [Perkinsus marinus ATCC 50983]|uniref:Ubiquitin-like domain-containing protein n=1 Tax=Perkinsus marinus (strain ATCC 50983 / TXsc) TaxID=423536 RepID=C5KHV6_PERM5|nr:hypothetical protein Pmar_PMAR003631 [Perkinsus marinus ATCC 50983]EER16168.1 hypothetical protein Pmar_PMAR003631 [Perkinsus marinus ATCC 50983]|eukprot:XP_002784372.1 hypothetical protein Pmar_PMAR003631 [Perkinsus marinus ATCC 50983]
MVLKKSLEISDEELAKQVEAMRQAYEKELNSDNQSDAIREADIYAQRSGMKPTTITTTVQTSCDADESFRRPSGLGHVKLRGMKTCDTLPNRGPLGMGRRMGCAGVDTLIRIYVYLPHSGDSFYLWVPHDIPVGPPKFTMDRFTEITGIAIEDQRLAVNGTTLKTNSVGINYYNVTHGCTVTLSKFESYEKRKASREQEPVLAVTMAKRVKGTSGNAITKALKASARRLNKTGTGYWIMPKWEHDEYPGLISEKLMRRFGIMSNDTVFYEDYLGKVHLTPGMGHGDPFGSIREAFERHNIVASLPQPSSSRFTHMGIIRNGYDTVYHNHHRVTEEQRAQGDRTLTETSSMTVPGAITTASTAKCFSCFPALVRRGNGGVNNNSSAELVSDLWREQMTFRGGSIV